MNPATIESLRQQLNRRREALFHEVESAEADLRFIAEDRETDLEERGQEERAARLLDRLDNRSRREIEEIDAALHWMDLGKYGICASCGKSIALARLQALPATSLCKRCATKAESEGAVPVEREEPRGGPPSADSGNLSDRELEEGLREQLRLDGRVDQVELRLVCRHGVLYLDGAVASAAEHQILRKLATDVTGFREVVDRVRVAEILFERRMPPKSSLDPGRLPRMETPATSDVARSLEEGLDYLPPDEPPPEEE